MSFKGGAISAKLALVLFLVLLGIQLPLLGQQNAMEDRVKAAYLFNFAKLAEWPRTALPDGPLPLVIGVSGGDEQFLGVLKSVVAGKSIGTHVLVARSISSAQDLKTCAIVFFRASGKKHIQAEIESLVQTGVLLVGEDPSFLGQGGMINLVRDHESIRFEVNAETLDRSHIHFSSKILALAKAGYEPSVGAARDSPVDTARQLARSVPPEYPAIAERMKLIGTAQVQVVVKSDGTVKEVKILGGHPLLADALARAVKDWKYQPAPKETIEVVKFNFGPQ